MKRKISLMLGIIIIFISFTACKNRSTGNIKTVLVCLGDDPAHFNVNLDDCDGIFPATNIFNRLIARDDMNNYVMDLAESWSVSEDGKEYTFYLNKGVRWHDGELFTSQDVKWTFDTIIKEKGLLVNRLNSIDKIICSDDFTVKFRLKIPDASFLSVVSDTFIMPKHIYEGTDWTVNKANKHPIGTGPFKFLDHRRCVSITLEANDNYFRGRPQIDRLIYSIIPDENAAIQAFKNREIDVIDYSSAVSPAAVPLLENMKGVKVVKSITTSRQYMAFNFKKELFNKLEIRQAIALAVDRDEIVEKAQKGYGQKAEGFYTPAVAWAYNDKAVLPERNVKKAKELLDKAGYKPDEEGLRIRNVNLVTIQFPVFLDIAKIVQANLREIGIEAKINVLEYSLWLQKVKRGNFDIAILGGDQGSDPEGLSARIGTEGALNFMGYSNVKIDNLLNKGKSTFRQEERANIYKEVQRIMSEELPIVPLSECMNIAVTKNYIKGHPIDDGIGKVPSAQYFLLEVNK